MRQGAAWTVEDPFRLGRHVATGYEGWLRLADERAVLEQLFLPKLRGRKTQRDEALAELGTAYFLEHRCHLPILAWEPPGANGRVGEYLVELPRGQEMFVEVKSPGWEGEVAEELGPGSALARRKRQPKHIHLEGRAYNHTQRVRNVIARAYSKMPDDTPTLLIFFDDLFVSLNDGLDMVEVALYAKRLIDPRNPAAQYQPTWWAEDGCFVGQKYDRIGAVGVLNVVLYDPFEYNFVLFRNPHARRTVVVPPSTFGNYPHQDGPSWPGQARSRRSSFWLPWVAVSGLFLGGAYLLTRLRSR